MAYNNNKLRGKSRLPVAPSKKVDLKFDAELEDRQSLRTGSASSQSLRTGSASSTNSDNGSLSRPGTDNANAVRKQTKSKPVIQPPKSKAGPLTRAMQKRPHPVPERQR